MQFNCSHENAEQVLVNLVNFKINETENPDYLDIFYIRYYYIRKKKIMIING